MYKRRGYTISFGKMNTKNTQPITAATIENMLLAADQQASIADNIGAY